MMWCSAERLLHKSLNRPESGSLSPWTAPQPPAIPSGDTLIGGRFHGNSDIEIQLDRGPALPCSSHPSRALAYRFAWSTATGQL
jgi:hypothetical protein